MVVIPGNHDINNKRAYGYRGDGIDILWSVPRRSSFGRIYRICHDEALSEDATTLSYVYQLDDMTRLLMLDTCQYRWLWKGGRSDPHGNLRLDRRTAGGTAWDEGMNVIPVAHHNLLEESEVYTVDCTIEHSEQLVDILGEWNVNIFLSGHLHVQHWMEEENNNLYEIVTSP